MAISSQVGHDAHFLPFVAPDWAAAQAEFPGDSMVEAMRMVI